jgi:hypothetical protein
MMSNNTKLMENNELNVIVMPEGSLAPEWSFSKGKISIDTHNLQKEIYERFSSDDYNWLFFLGFCDQSLRVSPSLDFWRKFAASFTEKIAKTPDLELIRHRIKIKISESDLENILDSAPMMTGAEYLNKELLQKIWDRLALFFKSEIKKHDGTVAEFIKKYTHNIHLVGRIFFNLVENKESDIPFAFLATYSTRINKQGQSKHIPLKYALKEYKNNSGKLLGLLSTVYTAAKTSDLISELLETGELFHPLAWSSKEAFTFLKEIPVYEESGILCRIPDWWKGTSKGISLNISFGDKSPSFVGMDALINFNPYLSLGDVKITEAEAKKLLEESQGLAFIKNKWVAVDSEKLQNTLKAYKKAKALAAKQGISINDALRMQLKPEQALGTQEHVDMSISSGDWLSSVIEKLKNPDLAPKVKPSKSFKAKLRKYQQKGLNWLWFLHSLGFGACLADDMGLGKTIQLLAFLSAKKLGKKQKTSILVIPASLIPNWTSEIEKFYPDLKFFTAHPEAHPKKRVPEQTVDDLNSFELVITTYALAQKYEWLSDYSWEYIILDEAQAIKNPGTKQTRALKKLKAENRIIMTGTPIENRLGDLWSLFDFLNPGLLGSQNEFKKFTKEVQNDSKGYSRLRRVVSPYILRRLKTDKKVISDLPDKVELKTYASLSKKQVVLYKDFVNDLQRKLNDSEGIQRKGLILTSLMKLKQLCNHPDQYLGTGDYKEIHSGKFQRLKEICETIYEKREKILIFTQFKEITEHLSIFLENIFHKKGLALHGSIPVGKRKKIIEHFQNDEYVPYLVLSLKAGGVGLNLTKANHVIHFDRWWNPAVENQATDRAFRIGQTKNVIVHKFISTGTVEEKIDKMLEEKTGLSEKVIAKTGEKWITEMDDKKVIDIFKLTL